MPKQEAQLQPPKEGSTASIQRRPSPSELARQAERSEFTLRFILRTVFMVVLVTVSVLLIAAIDEGPGDFTFGKLTTVFVVLLAVSLIVILVDTLTPKKRIAPAIGVYVGVCLALIGALAVGKVLDVVAESWQLDSGDARTYVELAKVVIGIILCYLAVSFVLTTKDDFRLVIPYVEFSKQVRGIRPLLLDTSVLIDGRIDGMVQAGFADAPLVVPRFVLEELQALSDSGDKLKRARGRRGLDMIAKLQTDAMLDITIDDSEVSGRSVDRMLVELGRREHMRILTTDYNLGKVAKINGVIALNINDLANSLKPTVIPGETLVIEVVKRGENEGQGVGYLPDGTMVVVEGAQSLIGRTAEVMVTNSLQTSAGRMIFGRLGSESHPEGEIQEAVARSAASATHQPRHDQPTQVESHPTGKRNPRR